MNGLPYYKAYPRDFIEGPIGMPFEIKCAYRVVLDLIYMQGGKLPDDARYISGLLGCTIRRWQSIRQALVDADKIQTENGVLTNYRAVIELETLAKLQEKQRENASGPRKNKGLPKPRLNHTEPEPDKSVSASALTSPEAGKPAPVADLPCVNGEPYLVFETDIAEWQASFPAVNVRQQLGAMRSWLIANPTRRKTKRGMRRFVVTWLDRKQNEGGSASVVRSQAPPTHAERVNAVLDRIISNGKSNEPPTFDASFERRDSRGADVPLRLVAASKRD
jgi:uncharacterized protein YdaU (DUF1376 family)